MHCAITLGHFNTLSVFDFKGNVHGLVLLARSVYYYANRSILERQLYIFD